MLKVCIVVLISVLTALPAAAQQVTNKAAVEKFYRPKTVRDMNVYLPPRIEERNRFSTDGSGGAFFSGGGGCPNAINIGSITDDSTIYGGADINVVVDGDIIIDCGGL